MPHRFDPVRIGCHFLFVLALMIPLGFGLAFLLTLTVSLPLVVTGFPVTITLVSLYFLWAWIKWRREPRRRGDRNR